jgi:hypothetical protein
MIKEQYTTDSKVEDKIKISADTMALIEVLEEIARALKTRR